MKCTEAKRFLEPYIDGELATEANVEVLNHLNLCAECLQTFECEKKLRGALRDACCAPTAPPALRDVCCRAMDRLDAQGRRRWMPVFAGALAAAALVAVALVRVLRPDAKPDERAFATMAVAFHDQNRTASPGPSICLKSCCASDSQAVADRFFTDRTGGSPCMHALDQAGYGWRSGVIWDVRGRLFCWTVQQDPARQALISHVTFQINDVADRGSTGWRRYEVNGRIVLMHNMGPLT